MKNKKIIITIILTLCIIAYIAFVVYVNVNKINKEDNFKITASINPLYVIALNITNKVEGVEVANLTSTVEGCPHDYQLTPKNIIDISESDVFLINGFGMETYLDKLKNNTNIVNVSDSLEKDNHIKENESDVHNHSENGHIWLDINKYKVQVREVTSAIIKADPNNKDKYLENERIYLEKLKKVEDEISKLVELKETKTIIFHNSSEPLLESLDIEIVDEIDIESESGVSANKLKNVIELIKKEGIKYVVTDPSYDQGIVNKVITETGVEVYEINSLINVDSTNMLDSYIDGMLSNIDLLKNIK